MLSYISETPCLGSTFDFGATIPENVVGYTDSDFAESKPDQKSTGRYIFMLAGETISQYLKLEAIVKL